MSNLNSLREKISWAKQAPLFLVRERAESALDCAVAVMEAQEKRISALEKQLIGVCRG